MSARQKPKPASYADVLAAPEHTVAEVIHGVLHRQPRPRFRHSRAATRLGQKLGPPFDEGNGGPGGWILLDEPELHLGEDIVVADLAGWSRSTMPEMPDEAFSTLRPDWACEVLSPSTQEIDRGEKIPLYAAHGVAHVWIVDPLLEMLEVLRLDGETYRLLPPHKGTARVRAEPFEAIELELGALWAR
jgi:Uma2 family endonuclease